MNDNEEVASQLGERGMMPAGHGKVGPVGIYRLPFSPARRMAQLST